VQNNDAQSVKKVLQCLYYQIRQPQGKLMRVIYDEMIDVVIDVCKSLLTFCKWVGEIFIEENKRKLWVSWRFTYAFVVLFKNTEFFYKTIDYCNSIHERSLVWNDNFGVIDWHLRDLLNFSKNIKRMTFNEAGVFD